MKGIFLPGNDEVKIIDYPYPEIGDEEVLIDVKASGLCGSDLNLYHGLSFLKDSGNFVPGHEVCGIIKETGKNVKNFKKRDRVVSICFKGCGFCRYCRMGWINLCDNIEVMGFHFNGGDAEYISVHESMCLPLPDELSYESGAYSTDGFGNLYHTYN